MPLKMKMKVGKFARRVAAFGRNLASCFGCHRSSSSSSESDGITSVPCPEATIKPRKIYIEPYPESSENEVVDYRLMGKRYRSGEVGCMYEPFSESDEDEVHKVHIVMIHAPADKEDEPIH